MPPATAGTSAAHVREQLMRLLEPVVGDAGYDLEDVAVASAGRRKLVRVTVDADGGIDLDSVAEVSRIVSDTLDAAAQSMLAGPYVLEVSSPGVDRPLAEPRHWRRAVGRLVTVPVGEDLVTGRLVGTDESGVTLDAGGVRQVVAWAELGRGRVQVEFNRAGEEEE